MISTPSLVQSEGDGKYSGPFSTGVGKAPRRCNSCGRKCMVFVAFVRVGDVDVELFSGEVAPKNLKARVSLEP